MREHLDYVKQSEDSRGEIRDENSLLVARDVLPEDGRALIEAYHEHSKLRHALSTIARACQSTRCMQRIARRALGLPYLPDSRENE